jgi:alkylated DNA repair protein alkB family protein 8
MPRDSLLDDWLIAGPPPIGVPGLRVVADYLDAAEERALAEEIDARPWSTDWRRRVQVYGLEYGDGRAAPGTPLPPRIAALGARIHADGLIERAPENAVVNEYPPGVGIGPHRDYGAFGPTVVGVSLLAWCVMDLVAPEHGTRVALELAPRSLYLLGGEARSRWKHGIAARKSDVIGGFRVRRERRLSITFRTASAAPS